LSTFLAADRPRKHPSLCERDISSPKVRCRERSAGKTGATSGKMPVPRSLSARLYALGLIAAGAVLILGALLLSATANTHSGFLWVQHSQEVMRTAGEMKADLLEAESEQRGYLLTRSPIYLSRIEDRMEAARRSAAALEALTFDNPVQNPRAARLRALVSRRIATMKVPLALAEAGRFKDAVAMVARGHGKSLMDELAGHDDEFMTAERRLLQLRLDEAEQRSAQGRDLLLLGVPTLAFLFIVLVLLLVASIRRPLRAMLDAMAAFGAGDLGARAPLAAGSSEFAGLAASYNAMAERLSAAIERQRASDEQLQAANAELLQRGEALAVRSHSTELLAAMAHRMQAARTDPDLTAVLAAFLPRVLPGTSGILYVRADSGDRMVKLVEWGNGASATDAAQSGSADQFAPDDCWALRRGQVHEVSVDSGDIACAHVAPGRGSHRCQPVLAGGDLVGLLYLEGEIGEDDRFRIAILVENVALALVNHRLQRALREQTIRDPLTNLFNRRYMEESLAVEAARSARAGTSLGILMCDIDHFKTFNDRFGHEAGDLLLQAVGTRLRAHFRDGDIACRYGGEEFVIIAPGADPLFLARRAEELRRAYAPAPRPAARSDQHVVRRGELAGGRERRLRAPSRRRPGAVRGQETGPRPGRHRRPAPGPSRCPVTAGRVPTLRTSRVHDNET
jgi:diguanylate cyclase (GGDEF)-like protein